PAAQAEPEAPAPTAQAPAASPAAVGPAFRRGLPRVAGGEPWPPAAAAPAGAAAAVSTPAPAAAEPAEPIEVPAPAPGAAAPPAPAPASAAVPTSEGTARRGLPRVAGGEAWPAAGTVVAHAFAASPAQTAPAAPAE